MLRRSSTAASSKAPGPVPTELATTPEEEALHVRLLAAVPGLVPPPSPATLTRYLRARSHDPQAAADMLLATRAFEESSPAPSTCPSCVENPRSHSFYPIGPSATGEPVSYSNYAALDTDPDQNIVHMRYAMNSLFGGADAAGAKVPELARMTWVMDMQFFAAKHCSPTIARKVLGLFAEHYPERLGCAVVYDAPYIFTGLFRAVKLFADPVTVRKVVFVKHDLKTRRAALEGAGIRGECLERLLKEIDDARNPSVHDTKNWWETEPLAPLCHYGKSFLVESAGKQS